MAWDLLDTHASEHGMLELYTQGMKEFMIRFDGIELMNSMLHTSEDVLGELAVAFCNDSDDEILIGGLGLGFTLAAAIKAGAQRPQAPRVTVAELVPTIIAWYQHYFCTGLQLAPDCARLIAGDAYQIIADSAQWQVICLDIDNGPSYLSTSSNQKMYAPAGLQHIAAHLAPTGACLVWSANEEADMVTQASNAGFYVYLRYVHSQLAARVFEQYIYVLSPQVLDAEFAQQQQLHFLAKPVTL
ncbi:MAG: hypothetical protein HYZ45_01955 [Burkholderiales bacterium]|nr:hypothetical protein [Burkholderiales bacterium]